MERQSGGWSVSQEIGSGHCINGDLRVSGGLERNKNADCLTVEGAEGR